jgi:hypothetical protein
VKLDKLAKQARRDLLANPKKAAVLGLMLLVAAYFWGPLLWKWLAPAGGAKGGNSGPTALILEDDPAEAAPQAKPGGLNPFRWEKVRQLIRSDRLMTPATLQADWPNPFAPLPVAAASEPIRGPGSAGAGELPATAAAELTPESIGLRLASVAIGPRRRTATISGDTYVEGEAVTASGKRTTAAQSPAFQILRIETGGVELERDGKTWWLLFDQPKLAQGDEIESPGRRDPN